MASLLNRPPPNWIHGLARLEKTSLSLGENDSHRLRGRLSHTRSPSIHFASLGLALAGVAGLIIGVAQPESGEEWIEVENEGRNILFCVDISRSMLARDIEPNRLLASRLQP